MSVELEKLKKKTSERLSDRLREVSCFENRSADELIGATVFVILSDEEEMLNAYTICTIVSINVEVSFDTCGCNQVILGVLSIILSNGMTIYDGGRSFIRYEGEKQLEVDLYLA